MIMQKQEFRSQIRFKRTLDTNQYFLHKLFTRMKKGYSQLIIICGQQQVGKSFIGIWLCYLFMALQKKEYNPIKHTFYDPIMAIIGLERKNLEPLLIDEAGSILTKREWYDKTHIALDKMIQTQGYKTMLYIFISPFTSDIDKTFQKHFDFQIRVDDKGRYKVFQIFKKYDEFKHEKSTRRRFLDDVRLKMTDLPGNIWKNYLHYSINEKEKMRLKTIDKHTKKENVDKLEEMLKVVGV